MTTTTTTTQPRTHQSWCAHHKEDGGLGFCCTKIAEVAGYLVELSDGTLDGAPLVYMFDPGSENYLTLEEARLLAATLTRICDLADGR